METTDQEVEHSELYKLCQHYMEMEEKYMTSEPGIFTRGARFITVVFAWDDLREWLNTHTVDLFTDANGS